MYWKAFLGERLEVSTGNTMISACTSTIVTITSIGRQDVQFEAQKFRECLWPIIADTYLTDGRLKWLPWEIRCRRTPLFSFRLLLGIGYLLTDTCADYTEDVLVEGSLLRASPKFKLVTKVPKEASNYDEYVRAVHCYVCTWLSVYGIR